MIAYRNAEGAYPRHIGDIRLLIPNWEIGDTLPEGWHKVLEVDPGEAPECLDEEGNVKVGRQNFWHQIDPNYDEVNNVWLQTWVYSENISREPPEPPTDKQRWEIDFEKNEWFLNILPLRPEAEPEA